MSPDSCAQTGLKYRKLVTLNHLCILISRSSCSITNLVVPYGFDVSPLGVHSIKGGTSVGLYTVALDENMIFFTQNSSMSDMRLSVHTILLS